VERFQKFGIACVAGGISVGVRESTPGTEYPASYAAGDVEMREKKTKGVTWLPAWCEFVVTRDRDQ